MTAHKVILDTDLAESLWRLPARSRREIIAIFEKLADYPLAAVEDQIRATDGRTIYRAKFDLACGLVWGLGGSSMLSPRFLNRSP